MSFSGRIWSFPVAGLLMLVAVPAQANQVPNATYTGTAATGGTVSFDVSAQGGAITRFAWRDVPTECGVLTGNFTGSTPIVDHAFDLFTQQPGRPVSFAGSFPANQQATGTLSKPGRGGCKSVGWTATTTAIAPPPPTSDEIPPTIEARAGRRLSPGGGIRVSVLCPEEACGVSIGGTVSVGRGARDFRMKRVEWPLNHGQRTWFDADLGERALKAAQRALRAGRRVTARVTLSVTDLAGNRTVKRFSIRLRRS